MRISNTMTRQERLSLGLSTQFDYEGLLDELATLRAKKVHDYGEERYRDPDFSHALLITYADLLRKMLRIKNAVVGQKQLMVDESLRDTFLDLANYAVMGAQLLDQASGETPLPVELYPEHLSGRWAGTPEGATSCYQEAPPGQLLKPADDRVRKPQEGALLPPIDQIAFATPNDPIARRALEELLRTLFGADHWYFDDVVAEGRVLTHLGEVVATNKARLGFNYQAVQGGVEFELLDYVEGDNYLGDQQSGLAHLATHVASIDAVDPKLCSLGFQRVQCVRTTSHSNPKVPETRRYKYAIYKHSTLGFRLKLIERVTEEEGGYVIPVQQSDPIMED